MIPHLAMDRPATAMTSTYAHADFRRARRRHLTARARRWLRPTRPRDLADAVSLHWQPGRRRAIPVEAIVGTVDATPDFDASFRPATERVARRWLSIARAHHDGRQLPPIDVIELTDGYYVIDGRHRVSVARALGHAEIEAHTSRAATTRAGVTVDGAAAVDTGAATGGSRKARSGAPAFFDRLVSSIVHGSKRGPVCAHGGRSGSWFAT
jgi:hypothetical protein